MYAGVFLYKYSNILLDVLWRWMPNQFLLLLIVCMSLLFQLDCSFVYI